MRKAVEQNPGDGGPWNAWLRHLAFDRHAHRLSRWAGQIRLSNPSTYSLTASSLLTVS
jgi:hypothetical protein